MVINECENIYKLELFSDVILLLKYMWKKAGEIWFWCYGHGLCKLVPVWSVVFRLAVRFRWCAALGYMQVFSHIQICLRQDINTYNYQRILSVVVLQNTDRQRHIMCFIAKNSVTSIKWNERLSFMFVLFILVANEWILRLGKIKTSFE